MTKDPHPDTRLVQALLDNNHRVVQEIYDSYFPRIRSFIRQNSGNEADAYDIFQEALLVIYTKARDEDLTLTAAFFTFLYGICRNLWLKQLRKKRGREVTLQEDVEFTDDFDLEAAISHRERSTLIRDKFLELKERCRKILRLTLREHKSHAEVAGIMGFANANVAKKEKSKCKSRLVALVKADPRYDELR